MERWNATPFEENHIIIIKHSFRLVISELFTLTVAGGNNAKHRRLAALA